jgi:hypothetical protein
MKISKLSIIIPVYCERNAHASYEITEKYAIVSGTLTQAMLNSVKIFEKGSTLL